MNFTSAIICVLFVALASSYAWGMRGTVIGGEKGAMLPGAFIGLILAWFAGGGIKENFWFAAAAGLMGMTYGGSETYGETLGFVVHHEPGRYRPVKGYAGVFLKGALWFSICGGFIALSMTSMAGDVYSKSELVIFCLLIPAFQFLGYRLFNTPYDEAKGIHPKCYYSRTRREEWGGNLLTLIAMIAMAIIKGDNLVLSMICGGFIGGGFGWIIALRFYEITVYPMKNGKYIFDRFFRNGTYDGWKTMEFTLGAIGGAGIAIGFCASFGNVETVNTLIATVGRNALPQSVETVMIFATAAVAIGIVAVNAYSFYCDKKGKEINDFTSDRIERTIYNVIPMIFVLVGSLYAARLMTAFMLVLVCAVKCVFERFADSKYQPVFGTLIFAACIAVFAGDIILGGYSPVEIIVAGTVPYLVAEFFHAISKGRRKEKSIGDAISKTAFATVYPCFLIMSAVLYAVSFKIFGI